MTTVPERAASWGGTERVATVVTVVFTLVQIGAVVAPDGAAALVAVTWSLLLFVAGSAAFLWAIVVAAGRSRDEQVTIAGVVWLTGSAPRSVARILRGALIVQSVVALVTAGIRPFSAVAFGCLAPMFGLGMLALHGARSGTFAPIGTSGPATVSESRVDRARREPHTGTDEAAEDAPPVAPEDPDDFDQLFRRRRKPRR